MSNLALVAVSAFFLVLILAGRMTQSRIGPRWLRRFVIPDER